MHVPVGRDPGESAVGQGGREAQGREQQPAGAAGQIEPPAAGAAEKEPKAEEEEEEMMAAELLRALYSHTVFIFKERKQYIKYKYAPTAQVYN